MSGRQIVILGIVAAGAWWWYSSKMANTDQTVKDVGKPLQSGTVPTPTTNPDWDDD
jgi:hypothetical protein